MYSGGAGQCFAPWQITFMTCNTLPCLVPSRRFIKLFTTNIPDMNDPVWPVETRALFEHITAQGGAMTIDNIVAWGESRNDSGSVIRHKLAWLSVKNRVLYDNQSKVWRLP